MMVSYQIYRIVETAHSKAETSRLRCELAATRQKLNTAKSELKLLEIKLSAKETELEQTKRQERSLQSTMERNERMNRKLAAKILKMNPDLQKRHSFCSDDEPIRKNKCTEKKNDQVLHSYRRKIWNLEQEKRDLEQQSLKLKDRINKYSVKFEHFSAWKEKVFWEEKAMVKMEGMNKRLESELNVLAKRMPHKLPLEKLVSDPFALDRMARHRVLQKRLALETRQKEELKEQMNTLIRVLY